jgi:hypothetical protein
MTNEQRLAEMERHVRELSEIYDAVQVCATWLDPEGKTRSQKRGSGLWYARQQICREFIEENIADDTATAIARKLNPPDELGSEA